MRNLMLSGTMIASLGCGPGPAPDCPAGQKAQYNCQFHAGPVEDGSVCDWQCIDQDAHEAIDPGDAVPVAESVHRDGFPVPCY